MRGATLGVLVAILLPGGPFLGRAAGADPAGVPAGRPLRAVIVTGHQYPGHPWRETTKALQEALAPDGRIRVSVVEEVEFLAKPELHDFDVVVFNYCNWERPGLSEAAKKNFVKYLQDGGGLVIVHFANGAFHFSLPKAGESDWPEWRTRICRRVWDHTPGKSGHDRYGKFTVEIARADHPITRGMKPFETTDELYFRQQGDEAVVVLATAHSQVTGRDEPMAFLHDYGKGRVFQTVLGHDAPALRTPGTAELVRRGTVWAAGRRGR
jgi:type 1 glutamine amidotransferase